MRSPLWCVGLTRSCRRNYGSGEEGSGFFPPPERGCHFTAAASRKPFARGCVLQSGLQATCSTCLPDLRNECSSQCPSWSRANCALRCRISRPTASLNLTRFAVRRTLCPMCECASMQVSVGSALSRDQLLRAVQAGDLDRVQHLIEVRRKAAGAWLLSALTRPRVTSLWTCRSQMLPMIGRCERERMK